jgi:hypothetical protein
MDIMIDGSEPHVLSEEPTHKLPDNELEFVTGGQGVIITSPVLHFTYDIKANKEG